MDSLASYGSDDEYENDNLNTNSEPQLQCNRDINSQRNDGHPSEELSKYDDGTNYDDVTMDMSEDSSVCGSNDEEEDMKLCGEPRQDSGARSRSNSSSDTPHYSSTTDREKRLSPPPSAPVRRGLLGDCPGDPNTNLSSWIRHNSNSSSGSCSSSHNTDTNEPDDAKAPLSQPGTNQQTNMKAFSDSQDKQEQSHRYNKQDKDKYRETNRDKRSREKDSRDRHTSDRDRHTSERDRRYRKRSRSRERDRGSRRRSYSRERDRDRRGHHRDSRKSPGSPDKRSHRSHSGSPVGGDYRASYKVSKKLHAMEKMGLQIKTPDGSMATPQMLMQRTLDNQVEKVKSATGIELPKYYNPAIMNPLKYAQQVQKKKLLWGNKNKETESTSSEANSTKASAITKWQGAKFAQDNDGKVASKFLRLMGVKDPSAVAPPEQAAGEIVKKQEEMFEAMQAQYDVARATTHTMRGVGLGFGNAHRHF